MPKFTVSCCDWRLIFHFRPLDGESFSKRMYQALTATISTSKSFRPLDGESFSKQSNVQVAEIDGIPAFRPLDGESFSKLARRLAMPSCFTFPSPKRGIIF